MTKTIAQTDDDAKLAAEINEMVSRLEAPSAEGWRPEVGATIIGKVVDKDTASAGGFGDYPLLLLADLKTGENTAVHCFHAALRNAVEHKNPQIGDRVAIKFLGTQKTKDGSQEFSNYKLLVFSDASAQDDLRF